MKVINAIVHPLRVDMLEAALVDIDGYIGMLLIKAEGLRPPGRNANTSAVAAMRARNFERVRIEIMAPEGSLQAMLDAITPIVEVGPPRAAGAIWVTEAQKVLLLRADD